MTAKALTTEEAEIWISRLSKYKGQYFRDGHSRHFTLGEFVNCYLKNSTDLIFVGKSLRDATGINQRSPGNFCEFSFKLNEVVIIDHNPTPQEVKSGDGFYAQIYPRAQIYLQLMIGDVN